MQSRLHLVLDALALLLAKATFIGLRLLALYLCAAQLDRATFGALALAFTTAEICRFVGDWGTDTWALRQFSNPDAAVAASRFDWVVRQRLAGSLVAALLAWFGIDLLAPQSTALQQGAITLTAVTSLWLNLGVNWLQARAALRPLAGLLAIAGGACAVMLWRGQGAGHSIEAQLVTLSGFETVMAMGVFGLTRRHQHRLTAKSTAVPPPPPLPVSAWWHASTPIALAALLAMAYSRFDQYYVGHTATAEVLGDYTLAQRLIEPVLFLMVALTSTLYVRASGWVMSQGLGASTARQVWRWVRLIGFAAAAVGTLVGLACSVLVPHWMPDYGGALPFLWIGAACTVFRCINLGLTAFIQATGAYRLMFGITVLSALSVTTAVLVLGHLFGPIGAALGVCLGEAVNTAVQIRSLRQILRAGTPHASPAS